MDGYRVALFFHLLALVAASAASGLVHVAESRSHRAATLREARMWLMLTAKTARTFPIAVVVLFGTGAYMISAGPGWAWGTGWVVAGIGGAILLLAQGAILGGRGRRIQLA